jgi:hypothetical protein
MLASKNIRPPVRSQEEGLPWLRMMSRELFNRLEEARTVSEGVWPKTISLKYRLEEWAWWHFGELSLVSGLYHRLHDRLVYVTLLIFSDPLNPKRPIEHSVQAPFPHKRVLLPEHIETAAIALWAQLHARPGGGPAEVHNVCDLFLSTIWDR